MRRDMHEPDVKYQARDSSLGLAIVCLVAAILFLILMIAAPGSSVTTAFLSILFGVIVLLVLIIGARSGQTDYFEIIYAISFLYLLNFCIRGLALAFNPHDINPSVKEFLTIDKALLYGIIGYLSFILGYSLYAKKRKGRLILFSKGLFNDNWFSRMAVKRILFIYCLGIIFRLVWIITSLGSLPSEPSGASLFSNLFLVLSYLSTIGFILFSLLFLRQDKFYRNILFIVVWLLMLIVETASGIIFGMRGQVVTALFIVPLFCYNYSRKRVSLSRIAIYLILLLIIFLILIMPLTSIFRESRLLYFKGSIGEYLNEVRASSLSSRASKNVGERLSELSRREIVLENFSIVLERTPEGFPYQYGNTFISSLLNLVPGFIFSGKEAYSLDRYFSVEFAGWEQTSKGSTGITNIGELYVNFGFFGIIIGMFILGFLYKFVYELFIGSNKVIGDLEIMVYFLFFTSFIWIEASIGAVLVDLISKLLILIPVIIFLRAGAGKEPI
jgi:hypothetical protein